MQHIARDAEGGELAVEMKAAGPGFLNHAHPVGARELFLHAGREAGGREALGRLGRLAIAHPYHAERLDVPVHPELELAAANLRFRMEERMGFHRHV